MSVDTATNSGQRLGPRRLHRLAGAAVLFGAGLVFCGWWWSQGIQSWWTARGLLGALRSGDCVAASKYYDAEPVPSDCSPKAFGLPEDLTGYSLRWDRVKHNGYSNQASVAVFVPGEPAAYSLHMVRRGLGWVVDGVDVPL